MSELKGGELDAAVAERVMGEWSDYCRCTMDKKDFDYEITGEIKLFSKCKTCNKGYKCTAYPNYSTDMASAWEVVEKLETLNPIRRIEISPIARGYQVSFLTYTPDEEFTCWLGGKIAVGTTAPEAICRAALAAVGER